MSVSRMPVRIPLRARARARLTMFQQIEISISFFIVPLTTWDKPAIVDFPTPPLAEDTATTFATSRILRFCGRPRRLLNVGGVPDCGRPYLTKSH